MKMGRWLVICLFGVLAGCTGAQSALDPQGNPAIHLGHLMAGIVAVCTLIWLLVILVLGLGLWRARSAAGRTGSSERTLTVAVATSVCLTALVVAGLTIASFYTTRLIGTASPDALTITVIGKQWWWQVLYSGDPGGTGFESANEIHIPVGQDVHVRLESTDVIHSFWVPSLAGKQDLVPGRTNTLLLRAEKPGVYRGQCAEFCGLQHSHMALMVIAEEPAAYANWAARQRAARSAPQTADSAAGEATFMAKPCAACHTVRGTSAKGRTGPDLTHVGSRRTIAAGLLETTRGTMAAWIADPQTLKRGNNMPIVPLTGVELRNVAAYLEGLK